MTLGLRRDTNANLKSRASIRSRVTYRKDRTDLPTAILLNLRNRDAKTAVDENILDFSRLATAAEPMKFHVVDGQHRILALKKLIDEDPDRWAHFMIPFVCLLGAQEEEEMEQFYLSTPLLNL